MKRVALAVTLLFVTLPAFADSINMVGNTFAPDGSIVDLPLVPGVDQLLASLRDPSQTFGILGFIQIFENAPTTTFLTWTLTLSNLASPIVLNQPTGTDCLGGRCILGGTFFVPITFRPVSGTLTVHLNDEIETFNFHYLSNAPEPTSLVLMGTGLLSIGWVKHRARNFSQSRKP
jgi:hypothetical protein